MLFVTPTPTICVRADMHRLNTASVFYCASVGNTEGGRMGRTLVHVMQRLSLAVASFLHGKEEHFIRIRPFSSAGPNCIISSSLFDLFHFSLHFRNSFCFTSTCDREKELYCCFMFIQAEGKNISWPDIMDGMQNYK